MRASDVIVEVADKSLTRQGQIAAAELNVEANIAHNETGQWKLVLPVESAMIPALSKPGSRIIITTDTGQFLSGPCKIDETTQGSEDPKGTVTFTGTTDNVLLKQRLAYPQPANANVATQTDADWKMTGTVEAVMHALVSANVGPTAPSSRRDERLVMGPNLGRGPVISVAARFEPLHDVLAKIATANAFTFTIAQRGDVLVFETAPMVDRSAEVRLSVAAGSLTSSKVSLSAPGVTHVIVGGDGAGDLRTFSEMTTPDSLKGESQWGERIEKYVDAGTGTAEEIKQPALDVLSAESNTGVATESVPAEDSGMGFGVDYFVGDQVAVEVDGQEPVAVVSGAILKCDSEGVLLQITVGDPVGFDPLVRAVVQAQAVIGKVNRVALNEIPFVQIDAAAAGAAAANADLVTANAAILVADAKGAQATVDAANAIITASNDATTKANTAQSNAITASGKTIWQPSAPTGANATVNNLWIDTTVVDGNPRNWPMRWNPASQLVNKWERATDYTALSAVIAAGAAQSRADLAYDSANGKNKITSSLTVGAPSVSGRIEGDTHWTRDGAGNYIAQYELRSGVWVQATYGAGAIADAAIVTSKIATDAVTTAALADAAVQTSNIANDAVVEAAIADAAVTTAGLAAGAVTQVKIANLAVGSAQVADAAIVTAKIGNLAVTSATIADLAVSSAKIANAAIVTAKIGDLAVTGAKIADATIGYAKITSVDLGTATVGQLHGSYITADSITVEKMVIASFDNLIQDPTFKKPIGEMWTALNGASIDSDGARGDGLSAYQLPFTGTSGTIYAGVYAWAQNVEPGTSFRLSISFEANVAMPAGALLFGIHWANPAGAQIGLEYISTTAVGGSTRSTQSFVVTVPVGATKARVWFQRQATVATGYVWIDRVSMARAANASLIVDGAITAKIVAGDRIRVGNPAADHIDFYSAGLIGYAPDGITPKTTIATSTGKITAVGGDFVDMLVRGTSTVQGILNLDGSGVVRSSPTVGQTGGTAGAGTQMGTSGFFAYNSAGGTPTVSITGSNGLLYATGAVLTALNAVSGTITGNLNITGTGNISAMNTTGDGMKIVPDDFSGATINFYENNGLLGQVASFGSGVEITSTNSAKVRVGTNVDISSILGNVTIEGNSIMSLSTYNKTTAQAANVYINSGGGTLYRSTSSARYKQDIEPLALPVDAILAAQPVQFHDRGDVKRHASGETWKKEVPVLTPSGKQSVKDGKPVTEMIDTPYPEPQWIPGFIAEQLHDAGLGIFVQYDEQGRPDAISDSRLLAAAIPLLRDHNDRLADLTTRLATLEKVPA